VHVLHELFAHGRGRVLAFCWLGWVFDFYDLILFAFLKGEVARDLELDVVRDLPLLDGLTLGATALGGFLFGRIADRHGRRAAIQLSILVYSVGAFATAFSQGWTTLLLARVVTGLGVGGEWGIGHTIVAETYPPSLRGRAAGVLQAGAPVAMAMAAAIASFTSLDWRTLYLLAGLPALLAAAARWFLPSVDEQRTAVHVRLVDLFAVPHRRASVSIFVVLLLQMAAFWSVYAWLPLQLRRDFLSDEAFVGWFFLAVNSVHIVADVLFGFLADRFGRRRTFVVFCIAFAAGLTSVVLGYDALRTTPVVFTLAFALIGIGQGVWSCFGVLFAENFPPALRATAAAGFYNSARGAQLVAQPLLGLLFVHTGSFLVALWVGGAAALLSAVAMRWVPVTESGGRG
jgi:MFS family permease